MKDEVLAHLYDIREAAIAIRTFISGLSFEDYTTDELLRSGVERKFEIIGEALTRVRDTDPDVVEQIQAYREVISFRNILIHGYNNIDDRIVWGIIEEDLDRLLDDVGRLLV